MHQINPINDPTIPGFEHVVQGRVGPLLHPGPVAAPLRPPEQPPDRPRLRAQPPLGQVGLEAVDRVAEVEVGGAEELGEDPVDDVVGVLIAARVGRGGKEGPGLKIFIRIRDP